MQIRTVGDIDARRNHILAQIAATSHRLAQMPGNPVDLFRDLKFRQIGRHPIEDRPLNVIEQINQTWTYLTALAATRILLADHPDAKGFEVEPGARAATPHDIVSLVPDVCVAEVFAATRPDSNDKLRKDIRKVAKAGSAAKYVFFYCPSPEETGWRPMLAQPHEIDGVRVRWLACPDI